MGFMAGKRALIVGVASDRSIATGIAEAFAREGADIAIAYLSDVGQALLEKKSGDEVTLPTAEGGRESFRITGIHLARA